MFSLEHLKANEHKKIIEYVSKFISTPNIIDKYGKTPLHYAVFVNDITLANYLLGYGANPNIQDNYGNTPLNELILHTNPNLLKLLLKYKVNPYIKDKTGLSFINYIFLLDKKIYLDVIYFSNSNSNRTSKN